MNAEKMKEKGTGTPHGDTARTEKLFSALFGLAAKPQDPGEQALRRARLFGILRRAAVLAAQFVFGALLMQIPLAGAKSIATGFVCAAADSAPIAFCGAMLGAFFGGTDCIGAGAGLLAAFCVRYCMSRVLLGRRGRREDADAEPRDGAARLLAMLFPQGIFREKQGMRLASAAVGGCVAAILGLCTEQGFSALLHPVFAAGGCFAFSGAFEKPTAENDRRHFAAFAAAAAATVLLCRDILLLGVALKTVAAMLWMLYLARESNLARGCTAGLLLGLCCDLTYAPAFAFGGIVCAALRSFGVIAVLGGFGAAVCYAVLLGSYAALRGVVIDMAIGAVLFLPLQRFFRLPAPSLPLRPRVQTEKTELSPTALQYREEAMEQRLRALGGVLEELSGAFYAMSDQTRRPSGSELGKLCGRVCRRVCRSCENESLCWGEEYAKTRAAVDMLAQTLRRGERAQAAPPNFLKSRCRFLAQMLRELDDATAALYEQRARNDKTASFAAEYENTAKLLSAAAAAHAADYAPDAVLSARMQRTLEYLHFRVDTLTVFSGRRREIIARGVQMGVHVPGAAALREAAGRVCGVRYGAPSYSLSGRSVTLQLSAVPQICVRCGGYSASGHAGEENGDAYAFFDSANAFAYAVLCDGMGSGCQAALTARIGCLLLEKLLRGGNDRTVSLGMLNSFLRAKQTECSCTVDLLELDLLQSRATLVKSGAAASFLLRQGRLFAIASAAAPLGILKSVHAEQTAFALCPGDILVLLSDGIFSAPGARASLCSFLERRPKADFFSARAYALDQIAQELVAFLRQEFPPTDDMSCILAVVEAAEAEMETHKIS